MQAVVTTTNSELDSRVTLAGDNHSLSSGKKCSSLGNNVSPAVTRAEEKCNPKPAIGNEAPIEHKPWADRRHLPIAGGRRSGSVSAPSLSSLHFPSSRRRSHIPSASSFPSLHILLTHRRGGSQSKALSSLAHQSRTSMNASLRSYQPPSQRRHTRHLSHVSSSRQFGASTVRAASASSAESMNSRVSFPSRRSSVGSIIRNSGQSRDPHQDQITQVGNPNVLRTFSKHLTLPSQRRSLAKPPAFDRFEGYRLAPSTSKIRVVKPPSVPFDSLKTTQKLRGKAEHNSGNSPAATSAPISQRVLQTETDMHRPHTDEARASLPLHGSVASSCEIERTPPQFDCLDQPPVTETAHSKAPLERCEDSPPAASLTVPTRSKTGCFAFLRRKRNKA